MANLTPQPTWDSVYELAVGDGVGPAATGGKSNDPHQNLANRTEYLKQAVDNHAALTDPHSSTSAATPGRIILRDGSGRAKIAAPAAADDIARKDTVDAVQNSLNTHAGLTDPHSSTSAATPGRIILRDGAGRAKIASPAAADDIARKDNVDAVQVNIDSHAGLTAPHSATSAVVAGRLIVRDGYGRAKIAAPSAADDIARKDTVDAVQANLTNHINTFLSSLTGNGYQKLPSGLIIQWGSVPNIPGDGGINVVFPVAFTTSIFSVVVSSYGSNKDMVPDDTVHVRSQTLTGFRFSNAHAGLTVHGFYVAIGY